MDQTVSTAFGAGELISVRNQATTIRGIITSVPAPLPGSNPALVNVAGDPSGIASFDTIDHIHFIRRLQPPYSYTVTEAIPNVDVADLQRAGTDYPAWVQPYTTLYYGDATAAGYSTARDAEIAKLAQSIVDAAGAKTPYARAKAIESWFLVKGRFSYTLAPPTAPVGVRPLDDFLFRTKKGFCQDFSTAMNVMLRTLGIPSRQISGYSVGVLDDKTRQWTVNSLDAHSWVEVYFPGYGWLPFEATPDGTNSPINWPATRNALTTSAAPTAAASSRPRPNPLEAPNQPGCAAVIRRWWPGPGAMRSGRAGWSGQRKMQGQKIASRHGAADLRLTAAMGDDETGRRMPFHQPFNVAPAEVQLARFLVVRHLGDDVVGGRHQRLELR